MIKRRINVKVLREIYKYRIKCRLNLFKLNLFVYASQRRAAVKHDDMYLCTCMYRGQRARVP